MVAGKLHVGIDPGVGRDHNMIQLPVQDLPGETIKGNENVNVKAVIPDCSQNRIRVKDFVAALNS